MESRASGGIHARFCIRRGGFCLDVDLKLPENGVSALFGPSGSGKTTCLRAMAGLERPPDGYFAIGGKVWQQGSHFVPPHRRALGVVFQEARLFPHLSVRQNMAYGEKRLHASEKRRFSLEEITALLGIGHLLERAPGQLSGGEQQRVAIARALLASPQLLLLDEPLASLDLQRKLEILPYLERLRSELSIPIVYVSHSPDEVARLADHLVLLDQGRVVASGPLHEVLSRIDLPAVFADDAGVVVETTVGAHEPDDLTRLDFSGGHLLVAHRPEAVGTPLRCRIHARDVSLALAPPEGSSILNSLEARVLELAETNTPGHVLVRLEAGDTPLLARITRRSAQAMELHPGMRLNAQIKAVALL